VFLQVLVGVPNPSQRQSLVEQLQGWGVVCRAVAEAKELARALRLDFRTAIIPLLICDDEMLAQGGEELGRLLAENKERVQCIMLASPAGSLGADTARAGTRATVLLKPVREQPLFDALVGVVAGEPPVRNRPPTAADTTLVPEAVATPPASAAPATTIPATDRPTTPLSCLRLLVAEDHPFNRKLCQLILDSFGVRAEWAVNGREAVEKFSPGRCDAILMDCNMPELDGFGATAAIRKLEAEQKVAHRVRIIALTANALVGERERCLAAGMDDYISKPFTTQQLYQALAAAVPAAVTLPATAAPTTEPASVAAPPTSGAAAASVIEPFNPARLEQLCSELDRDSVAEMVNDFLAEFPDRLADIHRLHETSQWPELERAAHSLKGLAALFGFEQLAARFLAIEDSAEVADAPKVKASVAVLDPAAQAAAQQLRDWLREVRNRPR
jgi:CheY-like chemotaxis protein/HPt (histidine-containing phosphotransfer) domain-containing protein